MVNKDLILDLAKLVNKYGVVAFQDLASFLRDANNIEQLNAILDNSDKLKATGKKKLSIKPPKDSIPSGLKRLEDTDNLKYTILNELYKKLSEKQVLPSLKDITFFREDNGLKPVQSKSHKHGVISLINDLSYFSIEQLQKIEPLFLENRGLKGWSDIILDKQP